MFRAAQRGEVEYRDAFRASVEVGLATEDLIARQAALFELWYPLVIDALAR